MVASVAAVLTLLPASAQARTDGQTAVCPSCVAISVDPQVVSALPLQLDGIEVLVRVAAGEEGAAAAALVEIERRGGRPGLLIEGLPPAPSSSALGGARRVVIVAGRPPASIDDQFAFQLKTSLTALRAVVADGTAIGLAADAASLSSLVTHDLGSYVDFLVASDQSPLSITGPELWRSVPVSTSLDGVLALSRTASATHWIWPLPSDAAAAAALAGKLARVAAQDVCLPRRCALHEREPLLQDGKPLLVLRMLTRRMEVREGDVAYEVDRRTACRISSRGRSPCTRPTR